MGGIYNSNGDLHNPQPTSIVTQGSGTYNSMDDDEFLTISIGTASLSRDNIYYVALKWKNTGTGSFTFYCTDDTGATSASRMAWITNSTYTTAGLPTPMPPITTNIQAAFWFILSG